MAARTNRRRRGAAIAVVAMVMVGALIAVVLAPRPVAVDTARVSRGEVPRVTLDHEGRTRVRNRYLVSAPVDGRVMRIDLEPGTPAQAGKTIVAVFRSAARTLLDVRARREAQARVLAARAVADSSRADLVRVRNQREHADAELQRTRDLARSGAVPPATLDAAEAVLNVLKEELTGERDSAFFAFAFGSVCYAALLLLA